MWYKVHLPRRKKTRERKAKAQGVHKDKATFLYFKTKSASIIWKKVNEKLISIKILPSKQE